MSKIGTPLDIGSLARMVFRTQREMFLERNRPACPICHTTTHHVAPVDVEINPAEWRCRCCRVSWLYEPEPEPARLFAAGMD